MLYITEFMLYFLTHLWIRVDAIAVGGYISYTSNSLWNTISQLNLICRYFSNWNFTRISLETDYCQSSEEVLAVAVAGLGEFWVQCIHYNLNYESRYSRARCHLIKTTKLTNKQNQKSKQILRGKTLQLW